MSGSVAGNSSKAGRAGARRRRAAFRPRISGWGSWLLRRIGIRWAEPRGPAPDWDDAEQW